uniref:Secreted protein n=1 Tax=Panagrellus redivivus TaxID=6233 RepID=A0A7E4UQ59_PANRE
MRRRSKEQCFIALTASMSSGCHQPVINMLFRSGRQGIQQAIALRMCVCSFTESILAAGGSGGPGPKIR